MNRQRRPNSKLVWSPLDILLLLAFAVLLGTVAMEAGLVAVGVALSVYTTLFYVRVYQLAVRQRRPWVLWAALGFAALAGQIIQPGQQVTGWYAVLWLALAVGVLLIMALFGSS